MALRFVLRGIRWLGEGMLPTHLVITGRRDAYCLLASGGAKFRTLGVCALVWFGILNAPLWAQRVVPTPGGGIEIQGTAWSQPRPAEIEIGTEHLSSPYEGVKRTPRGLIATAEIEAGAATGSAGLAPAWIGVPLWPLLRS